MSSPDITTRELDAVRDVVASGHLSIGPRIREFEEAFAAFVGAAHAVGVNSGTAGLHLAVLAAGVGRDDLVVTTPFSFIASANTILYEGGVPVFVDVEPETGNIDAGQAAEAAAALSAGGEARRKWLPPAFRSSLVPRVQQLKALLPIHCFGQPAAMTELVAIARLHRISLIEDACEAIGAEYRGQPVGTFGDASVFAFYPNKQMTTGEGGMVVTDDVEWRDLFRSLRNQGRDVFDAWLNHSRLGYNYRLSELSAALGLVQTTRLRELLEKRARVAQWYNERLSAEGALLQVPQIVATTTRMSWFVYVIRLAEDIDRDRLMGDLEAEGIPTRPYFSPIHLQPFYQSRFGYRKGDFPVTEDLAQRSLALPFSGVMTEEQVDYVAIKLVAAAKKHVLLA